MFRCPLFKRNAPGNDSGATIIEFAIVAPALFLLLIGTLEFGMIMFTSAVLEGATFIGSRTGMTGYGGGVAACDDACRRAYIVTQIQTLSGGFLDIGRLTINMTPYPDFGSIPADLAGAGADPGGSGAVVVYRVTYPWALFTPLMSKLIGNADGNFDITAVATVRNEPF